MYDKIANSSCINPIRSMFSVLNLILLSFVFVPIFYYAEGCCCSERWGYLNCGCNIFNCNCNHRGDDLCYYKLIGTPCGVIPGEETERCSAFRFKNSILSGKISFRNHGKMPTPKLKKHFL